MFDIHTNIRAFDSTANFYSYANFRVFDGDSNLSMFEMPTLESLTVVMPTLESLTVMPT